MEGAERPDFAGWWKAGARPGQVGPAGILRHVDSRTDLPCCVGFRRLQRGDDVHVDRAKRHDGPIEVTGDGTYEMKAAFPSDLVDHPSLERELRLVTCQDPIDPGAGHYRDNLVVFAAQAT
ncbi:MAG: class F sortase [Jiangellaceae bacterium]|nr:class F sortase [Jiangellaceae bacterium]